MRLKRRQIALQVDDDVTGRGQRPEARGQGRVNSRVFGMFMDAGIFFPVLWPLTSGLWPLASGLYLRHRRPHPIRTARQVRVRHHRHAARGAHGLCDFLAVARHHHVTHACFHRPPPHLHNHRHAGDIGQRLIRQSRGFHTCRNDNQRRHANDSYLPGLQGRTQCATARGVTAIAICVGAGK